MIQVIRCKQCGYRLFDVDAVGIIEIKCPRCKKVIITVIKNSLMQKSIYRQQIKFETRYKQQNLRVTK